MTYGTDDLRKACKCRFHKSHPFSNVYVQRIHMTRSLWNRTTSYTCALISSPRSTYGPPLVLHRPPPPPPPSTYGPPRVLHRPPGGDIAHVEKHCCCGLGSRYWICLVNVAQATYYLVGFPLSVGDNHCSSDQSATRLGGLWVLTLDWWMVQHQYPDDFQQLSTYFHCVVKEIEKANIAFSGKFALGGWPCLSVLLNG